jgi:hypothetical protein
MKSIRRRLASCALALTVLQFTLLFTAPISACCMRSGDAHAAVRIGADEVECCPAGSHPPGQCPLHKGPFHKGSTAGARAARTGLTCRMMCDAPHGPQFLLGAVGVLPAPEGTTVSQMTYALPAGAAFLTSSRPAIPDAPPPKVL